MAANNIYLTDSKEEVLVEVITDPRDFYRCFELQCNAFALQAKDALWIGMSPGWDTPKGKSAGAARMAKRLEGTTANKDGFPNTLFLKATVPYSKNGERVIAGVAIWQQLSQVPGYGDPLPEDFAEELGVKDLFPDDPVQQRFVIQAFKSLHKRRFEVVKEKKEEKAVPPATFVLDLCAVDPAFQRRGIARRLVQYGLDEAKRRGGIEATTEASSMGRGVYMKLGFKAEGDGEDIVYHLDNEFRNRKTPPNIFLRTQR